MLSILNVLVLDKKMGEEFGLATDGFLPPTEPKFNAK